MGRAASPMRIGLCDPGFVMPKSAASEHDAATAWMVNSASSSPRRGAANFSIDRQELPRTCAGEDRDAEVENAFRESCDKGIAAGDLDASSVEREIFENWPDACPHRAPISAIGAP